MAEQKEKSLKHFSKGKDYLIQNTIANADNEYLNNAETEFFALFAIEKTFQSFVYLFFTQIKLKLFEKAKETLCSFENKHPSFKEYSSLFHALLLYKQKQFQDSINKFDEFLDNNNDNIMNEDNNNNNKLNENEIKILKGMAYYYKGMAEKMKGGKLKDKLDFIELAKNQIPHWSKPHFRRGEIHLTLRANRSALLYFSYAISYHNDYMNSDKIKNDFNNDNFNWFFINTILSSKKIQLIKEKFNQLKKEILDAEDILKDLFISKIDNKDIYKDSKMIVNNEKLSIEEKKEIDEIKLKAKSVEDVKEAIDYIYSRYVENEKEENIIDNLNNKKINLNIENTNFTLRGITQEENNIIDDNNNNNIDDDTKFILERNEDSVSNIPYTNSNDPDSKSLKFSISDRNHFHFVINLIQYLESQLKEGVNEIQESKSKNYIQFYGQKHHKELTKLFLYSPFNNENNNNNLQINKYKVKGIEKIEVIEGRNIKAFLIETPLTSKIIPTIHEKDFIPNSINIIDGLVNNQPQNIINNNNNNVNNNNNNNVNNNNENNNENRTNYSWFLSFVSFPTFLHSDIKNINFKKKNKNTKQIIKNESSDYPNSKRVIAQINVKTKNKYNKKQNKEFYLVEYPNNNKNKNNNNNNEGLDNNINYDDDIFDTHLNEVLIKIVPKGVKGRSYQPINRLRLLPEYFLLVLKQLLDIIDQEIAHFKLVISENNVFNAKEIYAMERNDKIDKLKSHPIVMDKFNFLFGYNKIANDVKDINENAIKNLIYMQELIHSVIANPWEYLPKTLNFATARYERVNEKDKYSL